MTDGDDLLCAVLEAPDDDTPRLIYADWLEEHGDADRANFVRVQIEMFHFIRMQSEKFNRLHESQYLTNNEYMTLLAREKVIFTRNFEKWLEPLRQKGEPFQSLDSFARYQRGFIHEVWMRARTFLRREKILFRRVPCQHLKITQANPSELTTLVESIYLDRLHCLDLSQIEMDDQNAEIVASNQRIHHLKKLVVNYHKFTDQSFDNFLNSGPDWTQTELQICWYYSMSSLPKFDRKRCPKIVIDQGKEGLRRI